MGGREIELRQCAQPGQCRPINGDDLNGRPMRRGQPKRERIGHIKLISRLIRGLELSGWGGGGGGIGKDLRSNDLT